MSHHDDNQIDARLRDVPVPVGIAARVTPEALFDDAAIDRMLVRVDLPPGLPERVRHAVATMRAGAVLQLPGTPLHSRPAKPPADRGRRSAPAWRRMRLWPAAKELLADGGAVAAALSIVALMFFAGTELSRRLAAPAALQQRVAVRGPQPRPEVSAPGATRLPTALSNEGGAARTGGPVSLGTAVASGSRSATESSPPMSDDGARVPRIHVPEPKPATRAVEVRAAPAGPAVAVGDRGTGTVGIRTVALPLVGRQVPRVPGYDIAFEMAHGESPFVDPSAAVALAVDRPPLSLRTDSFDSLCETVRRERGRQAGRRPRRGGGPSVRTEEILAGLPAAPGDVAWSSSGMGPEPRLSLTAVRSLRQSVGSMFVEVSATAPPLFVGDAAAETAPLDVMLVLDQSAGPFASPSWQWLCRGLGRVIAQMRPADRLSVIVCGERPRLAALRADAAALASLLPELMSEPTARSADFDAAFRLVAAVDRREGRADRVVAAAHAVSLERCRREGREAFSAWQADVATAATTPAPVAFVLIDPQETLFAGAGTSQHAPPAAGRVAADPVAISRGLLGKVFGRATLVATGCRLEVAFDPEVVGSYRIVGHRQTAADALASVDRRGIELHAGETARVVYEVIRRSGGAEPVRPGFLSATLVWTPPGAGPDGRYPEQKVRTELADGVGVTSDLRVGLPSPHACELLLAVALGELAGASVHAEPWRQSAAGIAGVASRWQIRGDVTSTGGQLIDCLTNQGMIPDAPGR